MEFELETPAPLRRRFDASHVLLTPSGARAPQAGTLLPPMPGRTTEAPTSSTVA